MKVSVGVILASTREGRAGERVAKWVERVATKRQDLDVHLIDLLEWTLPYYRHPASPKIAEKTYADARERAWVERVASLDGFIVVTPEYNHGYPAALKNAFDYTYAGWNRKPIAFVSYGGSSGGVRAVQQLRQVAVELQMSAVRDEVNIPFVARAFDAEGAPSDAFQHKRLEALLDDLTWWTQTLKLGRERAPRA
jgi:NAD(P)H-dependent FMN reductase